MRCHACGFAVNDEAKFCQECGSPQLQPSNQDTDSTLSRLSAQVAERRQLTVLFCDLIGSADLSSRMDAEDLRDLIRRYHQTVSDQVKPHAGYVAQYLGDGVLIYFGYPQAFEDSASRAVASALDILSGIERLNRSLAAAYREPLKIRIGMHTGQVVVGEIGASGRTEQLAVGDTPNIAARIQDLAEPNSVLVSATTAELVSRRFKIDFRGEHNLKGIPTPVSVYAALSERTLLDEEIFAASTPMVNRVNELAVVDSMLAAVTSGKSSAILLTGSAGIGKSRMIQYFREQLQSTNRANLLEFRCSPVHRESALHPFADQLRQACRFSVDDSAEIRVEKLRRMLGDSGDELQRNLSIFSSLLSLPAPADAEPIDPQELRGRTQEALVRQIFSSTRSPVFLIIEDLHWMDSSSLEVVGRLLGELQNQPALLLMTSRPEFESPWQDQDVVCMALDRLSAVDVEKLIRNLSEGHSLSPSLVNALIDRVDGVPIFAEELTRNVVGSRPGKSMSSQIDDNISIPSSLQDALMARLDAQNVVRVVAQFASILGRDFDYVTVQQLIGESDTGLQHALNRLVDGDILLQSGTPPEASYMFRHALLQEAAYNSLLRSKRRDLHQRVGEILERRREEFPADGDLVRMLAYHWSRAISNSGSAPDVVAKTVGYLTEVGGLELSLAGYSEAEAKLDAALKLVESLPAGTQRDELELAASLPLSMVYMATVGWASDQARDAFSNCRELCLRLGDRPELAQVLFGFWGYNLFRAKYPKSLELAREVHQVALDSGNQDLQLQTHAALANSEFWIAKLDESLASAEQVLVHYDPVQHAASRVMYGMDPGVFALMFAVWVPWLQGKPDAARQRHQELAQLTDKLDHPLSIALALNTSCCYHVNRGDVDAAREAGERLLAVAQQNGLQVYVMFGVLFRGWAVAAGGAVQDVIDEVEQTYTTYVTYVGGLAQTYAALMVADVYKRAGRQNDALKVLDNVLAVAEHDDCCEYAYHAELLRMHGEIQADGEDNLDAAAATLERAVALAVERRQPPFALRAAVNLLQLAQRRGAPLAQSIGLVSQQLDSFATGEDSSELRQVRKLIADLGSA